MYPTGGCEGRNEGGESFDSLSDCKERCDLDDTCISFEVSKKSQSWHEIHPEKSRCSLSTSCTFDESRKLLHHEDCLYVKGQNVDSGTPLSNNSGESTRHTHCPFGDTYKYFGTDCDGTILAGTECDFWFLCKEREYSNRVKLT